MRVRAFDDEIEKRIGMGMRSRRIGEKEQRERGHGILAGKKDIEAEELDTQFGKWLWVF